MNLEQLFEAKSLISYKNWQKPRVKTLKADFEKFENKQIAWQNRARIILSPLRLFLDFEDFREKVESGKTLEVDREFFSKVQGVVLPYTIGGLKDIVSTYATRPDVQQIISTFNFGLPIEMPVIIHGKRGYWMLSGNTRSSAAIIMGYKPRVIIIDAFATEQVSHDQEINV